MRYQLVTRVGCHLCDDAESALRAAGVAFEQLDVDRDAELVRLYDFRVPVLLRDGAVVLEGRIDQGSVAAAIRKA